MIGLPDRPFGAPFRDSMRRLFVALLATAMLASPAAARPATDSLDQALTLLSERGQFSGAVVIRDKNGIRFSKGYGLADPFASVPFTPDTQSESGSLAKPVTAAALLRLVRKGQVDLDRPVRAYVAEYPDTVTSVRHLLSHSAGLPDYGVLGSVDDKTTAQMLRELAAKAWTPPFVPGRRFAYCNLCYDTLALLVERVSGQSFQTFVDAELFGPAGMRSSRVRPVLLADWSGRAIGYRRTAGGKVERFDSWDREAFYGGSNIAFTAADLARWGMAWVRAHRPMRDDSLAPAIIGGTARSSLTLGNWNCAPSLDRCHYTGHHEGFHGFVHWDSKRSLAVAMLTNNSLAPELQQPLQRALVAFAQGRADRGRAELERAKAVEAPTPGRYRFPDGRSLAIEPSGGQLLAVDWGGVRYAAFPASEAVRYVPGPDAYVTGDGRSGIRWLTLYEDLHGRPDGTGH